MLKAGWARAVANNLADNANYLGSVVEWAGVKAEDAAAKLLDRVPGVHVPEMTLEKDDQKVVASMPVSKQSLEGKVFRAAYEFANNPVGGRHHIRVFDTGRADDKGRPVWAT